MALSEGITATHPMRILILCTSQFGYQVSTYYYCKHGREVLDITYMGFEGPRAPVVVEGVCVKPVSSKGSKIIRFVRWIWNTVREVRKGYDIVLIRYFPACSLLRLLAPQQRFVCDIRTGSIRPARWQRHLADWLMVVESRVFRNVTLISESLARKLNLRPGCYQVLPLGADVLAENDKSFDALHLLYVGTLSGREVEKTIQGFAEFYRRHKGEIEMSYTIVGDGYHGELQQLRKRVADWALEDVVKLLGYVHHAAMGELWEKCNVGVSFIPINEIYDCQPATKTFEYLLAGMPVIATATSENRRVVNAENGVIIDDSADGFAKGLEMIFKEQDSFSSATTRRTGEAYQWSRIVGENLCPYLSNLQ